MNTSNSVPNARALWKPQAGASDNGDFISVETYSSYSLAIGDPTVTEYLLSPEASDEELGCAVLGSLRQSRFLSFEEEGYLLENATSNYKLWVEKLMTTYGYKTKRALFKNMKSCGVECKDNIITIRPSNHEKLEGWSGDGISQEDYVKVPSDSPPAEIGRALRLAFSRCIGLGS
ncbi:MAG: CdiI family contact-dependent growth inhibition immunity protein [Proteobacteria bacterium]|nr:CdiI family contact-dependent growth inhibition immunity protein [Pseudomonadota bacterium]